MAALYLAVLALRPGSDHTMIAFGDLALVVAPLYGTLCASFAARRHRGSVRAGWALIGTGTGLWGAGQIVWCWYELIGHRPMPYPSLADVGYLGSLPLTAIGLALLSAARQGRWRMALDATMMSVSLLAVSWAFVLGPLVRSDKSDPEVWMIGIAYPIGDVGVMTMALLVFGHVRQSLRGSVALLVTGAVSLSLAHGVYAFQVMAGTYVAGTWLDFGWFGGYLLIGLAATSASQGPSRERRAARQTWLALPYFPLTAALLTSVITAIRAGRPETFLFCLTLILVVLVVVRQLIGAADNRTLTAQLSGMLDQLRSRESQLRYQAFHDGLTGLANRAFFTEQAVAAVQRQDLTDEPVAAVFVDLDGFKPVNDRYGHHAGDLLLVLVADRLRGCVRESDTVARLGGDEFAVLVEGLQDRSDATAIADRIVSVLAEPFELLDHTVRIGASVGVAVRDRHSGDADDLIRHADTAMYQAKNAGKGRRVMA
ncbi:diguanylate cyclase domain-containing protein [Actinoplanes sp. HUAS TT8]|uniref:diguanylate cyclase domain-containing protein n=1 Tax=Actinoplanes sp. HUAS TT8 TaxID=3447453 RepID=UPI003F51D23B